MKAVVHIGVSKAGSTTIQENTFAHRAALMRNGVLVPALNGRIIKPVDLANAIRGSAPTGGTDEIRSAIEDDIARHRPQFLFLSSEYLYYRRDAVKALESFLAPWTDDIEVVLYVRDPVGRYLSLFQQSLGGQDRFVGPAAWRGAYRPIVESWRRHYGQRLTVLPFQKSAFPEGLVTNLFNRFFPDIASDLPDLDDRVANRSEPSEVTQLLETYFRVCHQNAPREFRPEVQQLRRYLVQAALETGVCTKPTLRPEVSATILLNHSEDLAWLAAEEGIVFDGLDASANAAVPLPASDVDSASWSDIVTVDPDEVQKLIVHAARDAVVRINGLEREIQNLEGVIQSIVHSRSWQITSPFRILTALLRHFLYRSSSGQAAKAQSEGNVDTNT